MKITQASIMQQTLTSLLSTHLKSLFPAGQFLDMATYAVLPAGKLFRPMLACATYYDELKKPMDGSLDIKSDLALVASFLEIHHAYTLVHDDLPCMDNDDERRGRASHHKAFGEWQALLTGDALLIASFRLLAQIRHPKSGDVLKLATWATGARGLILGQYKDLSLEMQTGMRDLLETHLYKTARLIQLSLTLPLIILDSDPRRLKAAWRMGASLGILFQLLDDLCELSVDELSEHENAINPWPRYQEIVLKETLFHLKRVEKGQKLLGPNTRMVTREYFSKIVNHLNQNLETIKTHYTSDLTPVMSLLHTLTAL